MKPVGIGAKEEIFADSAEPKSLDELVNFKVNAYPVTKRADSINYGIQIMQNENYLVTKKSVNLINELQKYTWAKDKKTGETLNKPIDNFNHSIDAWRYHEMETLGKSIGYILD